MESFDIDAFLSKTFKDMESKEKEKSKKKSKQQKTTTPMIIEKDDNYIKSNNKIIIQNIPKEKINTFNENKIDMKIYSKINLDEIKDEKNIQTKNLIKPLFPNDEVFE